MTTSLVSGGAGFIGSHVVDHLIKMGHMVVVLDDLSGGSLDNLPADTKADWLHGDENPPCIFVEADICDANYVDTIFRAYKPDYVFHLAAYAAEGLSHHIRRFNYETNVVGSVNLINAAVNYGVKRFVFTSSAAVYGHEAIWMAGKYTQPIPVDPYGIAKYSVELDLKAAERVFGLNFQIFRPHNVYGERQNLNDGYRNVVGIFMRQCLLGQPMTIFGDGAQTRQFSYIDDVAPYIARSAEIDSYNGTWAIGSNRIVSINDLAYLVARSLGVEPKIVYLPPRSETAAVTVNHDQFERDFHSGEPTLLEVGITKMAAWARTQQLRETKPFAAIEIEKGLPDSWRKLHVD